MVSQGRGTPVNANPETENVRRAALDYFEGWFDGDPERMDRSLHPSLVKRRVGDLTPITKEEMVGATREGVGKRERGRELEVDVVEVYGDIATVIVRSVPFREYLHLVRGADGWQIANALYTAT